LRYRARQDSNLQPSDSKSANIKSQSHANKELTESPNRRLQTSLQTKSENTTKTHEKLPEELAEIVSSWPKLPEHIKAAIKALIQSYNESEKTD